MMIPLEEKVFIIRKLVEERERSPLARFFVNAEGLRTGRVY